MTARRAIGGSEQGFAMVSALMLVLLALTLGAATLLYTVLDLKSTQHYETGNQAFAAAEAGLVDVINRIQTVGVMNFQKDVIQSGIIPTTTTSISDFPNVTYQVTSLISGANVLTDGIVTLRGDAQLSADRVIKVAMTRGGFNGAAGALHLSKDDAVSSFSGNSMTIDGNNWNLTDLAGPTANLDPSVAAHPGISTRNDTVTGQVVTALAGQGTIIGLGPTPSVMTTAAASTAQILQFINDILAVNGAPNGCNIGNNGNNDYWIPSSPTGVHCVPQTKGNQGNHQTPDFWGNLASPQVTDVLDTSAHLAGGSSGAGVLIFEGDVGFNGNFAFCGWVLFKNPSSTGIQIGGNVSIYGTVWTPLPAFGGNGGITVRYSQNCLQKADDAGIGGGHNLPHPMKITSWSEL